MGVRVLLPFSLISAFSSWMDQAWWRLVHSFRAGLARMMGDHVTLLIIDPADADCLAAKSNILACARCSSTQASLTHCTVQPIFQKFVRCPPFLSLLIVSLYYITALIIAQNRCSSSPSSSSTPSTSSAGGALFANIWPLGASRKGHHYPARLSSSLAAVFPLLSMSCSSSSSADHRVSCL